MKATLLAVSALALLAGGAGTGYMAAHNDNETILKNQMAGQKQIVSQMKQMEHTMMLIQVETLKAQSAENFQNADVSENFIIIEIENGSVRGEPAVGTGEGIFYPETTFTQHGIDGLVVGDEVTITWSNDAYENEDWDIIKEIGLIVK